MREDLRMNEPVSPGTLTRQQIYDRIRESSKEEVILEEMIRLGFWPDGEGAPAPAAELIEARGEAMRELSQLQQQNALWDNPERALKEMHKRRKAQAMARRGETRRRHAEERQQRAAAWHERRQREVLYLGEGVSAGLHVGDTTKVLQPGCPVLGDARALADAMGIALAELRFLTFNRPVSTVSHYQRFRIPKKTGGERVISAPQPRLKRAQYWVLDNILNAVKLHDAAHGFVTQRSIVSNARNHVGRDVVINLDLKDFFPTLTFARVKGLFEALGYAEAVATPLALICTEAAVDEMALDGKRYFVAGGPRLLPQGAPSSPAITNLICRKLDRRLSGLAGKLGFTYSRYADDLTFSACGEATRRIGTLLKAVDGIVSAEGFTVHPDKTRVMRKSSRQEVTGLTVNERVAVPRPLLRRFRAVLQQVETHGPEGRHFGPGRNVVNSLLGFAHFVSMVDPEVGRALLQRAEKIAAIHAPPARSGKRMRSDFRKSAALGEVKVCWQGAGSERRDLPDPKLTDDAPKTTAPAEPQAVTEPAGPGGVLPPPGAASSAGSPRSIPDRGCPQGWQAGTVELTPGPASDAASALFNLGHSWQEAAGAVAQVMAHAPADADTARIIRLALRELAKSLISTTEPRGEDSENVLRPQVLSDSVGREQGQATADAAATTPEATEPEPKSGGPGADSCARPGHAPSADAAAPGVPPRSAGAGMAEENSRPVACDSTARLQVMALIILGAIVIAFACLRLLR